jgi:acyl carrier protein
MRQEDIQQIVLDAMEAANQAREPHLQLRAQPDAPLFGAGSPLDSIGLVGLLVDIEDALRDRGLDVELSDARAMSQSRSPFRSVAALVDYVSTSLAPRA